MRNNSGNPHTIEIIFLIIFFFASLFELIKEYRLRKKVKKWHGSVIGTITEIKKDYHYDRLRKKWYEYPVVTYTIGSETYCQEYLRDKKSPGTYETNEEIPLIYNEQNPNEFIFKDAFTGLAYHANQWLMIALLIFSLYFSSKYIITDYLSTHELLWEEETWADLKEPLSVYSGIKLTNAHNYTTEDMNIRTEEAIEHFHQINQKLETKKDINQKTTPYITSTVRLA